MKNLVKKYEKAIKAEIEARGIELAKPFEELSTYERRDVLRVDELKIRSAMGLAREGLSKKDITDIVPISNELKAVLLALNEANGGE